MLVKRKRLGKTTVTFVVDAGVRDEPVFVTGDFNGWSEPGEPLKKAKDGTLRASIPAEPGSEIAFRYVTASGEWFDDDAADDHVPNEHGSTNGVVRV